MHAIDSHNEPEPAPPRALGPDYIGNVNHTHRMLSGTAFAISILLALVSWTLRLIEQKQVKKHQPALASSKTTADHIAIGAGKDCTR